MGGRDGRRCTAHRDALRIDTFAFVNRGFWNTFHAELHQLFPRLTDVGEVFQPVVELRPIGNYHSLKDRLGRASGGYEVHDESTTPAVIVADFYRAAEPVGTDPLSVSELTI